MSSTREKSVANMHQLFLENQTKIHLEYLNIQQQLYQKAGQLLQIETNPGDPIVTQHKYLFDPDKESWIKDHCPTFTRPALAMTSIVDIMASQGNKLFPNKNLINITDVRVFQWAILDKPKMLTIDVNKTNSETAQVALSLQETENQRTAKAILNYADAYLSPPIPPQPIAEAIEEIADPYSYLFHGLAFQSIRSLSFGKEGSTMILNAQNNGPIGCLNHILLDGATQGVYHENGLSFWSNDLPDNHVCYPALIKYMNFYGQTPTHGTVRCETRFAGFHFSKTLPTFHMYLVVDTNLWCEFELVYAILPMGFMATGNHKDKKNFTNFIKHRRYSPEIYLSDCAQDKASLKIQTMQDELKSQWFPYLIADIYGINEEVDIETFTAQILIKDFIAQQIHAHPSDIEIVNDHTAIHKAKMEKFYYTLKRQQDEFEVTMKTE